MKIINFRINYGYCQTGDGIANRLESLPARFMQRHVFLALDLKINRSYYAVDV